MGSLRHLSYSLPLSQAAAGLSRIVMTQSDPKPVPQDNPPQPQDTPPVDPKATAPKEIGGPTGPEPTRFGDWEKNGRCSDF